MNMDSYNFLLEYCRFDDPEWVWVITLMSRNKDNTGDYDKVFRRYVVSSIVDISDALENITLITWCVNTRYRIYVSQNPRNVRKGFWELNRKMSLEMENLAFKSTEHLSTAKKMDSVWKSALEQNRCRADKRFLLDIDSTNTDFAFDVAEYIVDSTNVELYCVRQTLHGWAIVFGACDTRKLLDFCEGTDVTLHRDSLLYIESFIGG